MTNYYLILTVIISSILFSCNNYKTSSIGVKELSDTVGTSEIIISSHAGGLKTKNINRFDSKNAEIYFSDKIDIRFNIKHSFVEWAVPESGLCEDWEEYRWFNTYIENRSNKIETILISIYGSRNVLSDTFVIKNGEIRQCKINLDDLPLTGRNINLYNPIKIRISSLDNDTTEISFTELQLIEDKNYKRKPVVDKFGQRINAEWKGKVHSEEELLKNQNSELKRIDSYKRPNNIDKYGGLKDIKFKATGYFYVAMKNEKYWFVTPEGNAFWSLGVTGVRSMYERTDVTKVKGRESLFEELPSSINEVPGAWDSDTNFSFYKWNLYRKYDSIGEWHEMTQKRLQYWGMNTIGNWSEKELLIKSRIPFTYSFRASRNEELKIEGTSFSDVFDKRWPIHLDSLFSECLEFKDNPYLIGYFVDNEGSWGKDILSVADTSKELRNVWLSMVKKKYSDLSELNKQCNTTFKNWEEVRNIKPQNLNNNAINDLSYEFNGLFAEQYFKTISETLKKYDPNHLYLSCRFTRKLKPDNILTAAGKYSDVITVNVYAMYPEKKQMDAWYKKTGKPILIGEHHYPLLNERQLPPHYRAFTESERETLYPKYIETWAKMPYSLGSHWYQFIDQHITGRATDGENQTVGLLDITDQPHEDMVKAIKESSAKIYTWHN